MQILGVSEIMGSGPAASKFEVINFVERIVGANGWHHEGGALEKREVRIKWLNEINTITVAKSNLFAQASVSIIAVMLVMHR